MSSSPRGCKELDTNEVTKHTGMHAHCHAECSGLGSEMAAVRRISGLSLQFVRCAYIIIIMAVYWCTEVIPLAITALLPALLFPLFKILDSKQVSSPKTSLPMTHPLSSGLSCIGSWGPDHTLFVGSLWQRDVPLTLRPLSKLP